MNMMVNLMAPAPTSFGEIFSGSLGVRLATSAAEVDAAQALRYAVFHEELGARGDAIALRDRRDRDRHDAVADHLVVIDYAAPALANPVIATYRLIRAEAAARVGGFYSEAEYDIRPLLTNERQVLELGRSCVHARYRSGRAMQLLWRGLAAYVAAHRIDLMFGCASLPGTDPDRLAEQLSFLYRNHLAPAGDRPRALPHRHVLMERGCPPIDPARALASLPPLVKGYLRVGGCVGDGAVIDREFNTTDVAIVVRTEQVTARYLRHYDLGLNAAA